MATHHYEPPGEFGDAVFAFDAASGWQGQPHFDRLADLACERRLDTL
jgi:hypothetical protein